MEGEVLRDDQWERLREFVPGGRKGKRGPRSDGRLFLDALLWLARSGGRWRDLPEKFGPYQTAKRRYYRWVEQGVIDRIFEAVSDDPDIEWLAIDATVIRAQAQAAGARVKRMARPVGKRFVSDDLVSLRKRIRPFSMVPLAKMEIRASWSS